MVVDRENILLQLSHKVKTWHGPRETSVVYGCHPMYLNLQMNMALDLGNLAPGVWKHFAPPSSTKWE